MSNQWSDTGNNFTPAPVGTHLARCVAIIDIGTHTSEYKGEANRRRQNVITWELVNELMEDGRPFVISKFYTTSLGEKANLRKDLANWRGRDFTPQELRGFDPKTVLGKPCQVSITEKDGGKRGVTAVTSPPKGVTVQDAANPLVFFSLSDDWDANIYDGLSKGIQRLITESEEYRFIFQNADDNAARAKAAVASANPTKPNGVEMAPVNDSDPMPF